MNKIFNVKDFEAYKNYVIEASAGTGKTYNIIEIVKSLVNKFKFNLEEILIVTYTEKAAGELKDRIRKEIKNLIKVTIPVTVVGIMMPLSHVLDSFTIVNILKTYRLDATNLYGLLSGAAATIIHLPVAVCYGIATVAIPAVSGAKNNQDKQKSANKTVLLTLAAAITFAILCYALAPFVVRLLFSSLSVEERLIASNLIKVCSPCIVLLSLMQTLNAVLIGGGRLYAPVVSTSIGLAVKVFVSIVTLKNPQINIYGGAIGIFACYFTVCLINLIVLSKERLKYASKKVVVKRQDCRE